MAGALALALALALARPLAAAPGAAAAAAGAGAGTGGGGPAGASLEGDPDACHKVVAGKERERWGAGVDRCEGVALYCEQDGIVNWLEVYFCAVREGSPQAVAAKTAVFWVGLALLLIMLFLALGSTAEDYFAPVLTQMCEGMGLPPRFAGVTFLALANGAPDVSATLAAIREGGDGLYLSLGALTGAGMFVTTVAVALVIIAAGGASMKGALLRDLLAYIGALVLVAFALSSGRLSKNFGLLLVGIYFGFVLIVLAADMWHRRIKVMSRAREITQPLVRQVSTRIRRASIALGGSGRAGAVPGAGGWAEFQGPRHGRGAYMEHVFKNLDKKKAGAGPGPVPWSRSASGRVAIADRGPPSVSPAHSLRDMQEDCSLDEEQRTTVEMGGVPAGAPDGGGGAGPSTQASSADQSGASWGGLSGVSEDLLEGGGEPGGGYGSQGGGGGANVPKLLRAFLEEARDRFSTLPEAFGDHAAEQRRLFREYGLVDRLAFILELPLVALRWATIPTVIEETYNRGLLCLSAAGSCLFMLGYLTDWTGAGVGLVGWMAVGLGAPLMLVALVCATENTRAPRLSLGTSNPVGAWAISLVGFVVAACWIDTLANELVGALDTIGTLAHFSRSILGLTILAWGNSIGDVKTNLAMARRGLGNMAITACVAGPLFNLLMGLGAGVIANCSREGTDFLEAKLTTDILVGIVLICTNCAAMIIAGAYRRGRIPRKFGYLSLALYLLYLVLSALHILKIL